MREEQRTWWNNIELDSVLILVSKALIDSFVSHDEFVLVNNVLWEYDAMKEQMKNLKASTVYQRFWSIYKTMLFDPFRCSKNT